MQSAAVKPPTPPPAMATCRGRPGRAGSPRGSKTDGCAFVSSLLSVVVAVIGRGCHGRVVFCRDIVWTLGVRKDRQEKGSSATTKTMDDRIILIVKIRACTDQSKPKVMAFQLQPHFMNESRVICSHTKARSVSPIFFCVQKRRPIRSEWRRFRFAWRAGRTERKYVYVYLL